MTDFEELKLIVKFIKWKYNINFKALANRIRSKALENARFKFIYLAKFYSHDNEDIGRFFKRSRESVYRALQKINEDCKVYPEIKCEYTSIKDEYDSWRSNFNNANS